MSRRHREEDEVLALKRPDRLAEHRRKRRVDRQALHCDGDEAVLHVAHEHLHAHYSEKPRDPGTSRRDRRHWKQPFWKRRTTQRREKAAAYLQVADT